VFELTEEMGVYSSESFVFNLILLQELNHLKALEIQNVRFTDTTLPLFSKIIENNSSSLQKVGCDDSNFEKVSDDVLGQLTAALSKCKECRYFASRNSVLSASQKKIFEDNLKIRHGF
jgi:hypothetical protein